MSLKDRIQDDMKTAMRAKEKERLAAIRLILAALKQREVDDRVTLDDAQIISILERMSKQRRESITQYQDAGRADLATKEQFELDIIQGYMPAALSDAEIEAIIDQAIVATGAQTMKDMGKVMNLVKQQAHGRADLATVSARVKARLTG